MNIGDQRNYNFENQTSYKDFSAIQSKTKIRGLYAALMVMAVVGVIAFCGCNRDSLFATDNGAVSLWEKTCYDCVKCEDDKLEIISATYGDKIITTDLIHRYNTHERTFPAGDSTWGETWPGTKKTLVFTYRLCNQFFTRIIEEGQALVLP